MKRTRLNLGAIAAAALAAATFMSAAQATPTVYFSPAPPISSAGPQVAVDLMISGIDTATPNPVAAFQTTLSFNTSYLSGHSFIVDPDGAMGVGLDPSVNDASSGFSGGTLGLFFVADISLTPVLTFDPLTGDPLTFDLTPLSSSEGTGFRLATITFDTLQAGLSSLSLTDLIAGNFDGTTNLANPNGGGNAITGPSADISCTGSGCTPSAAVPEPATPLLVAAALGALTIRRQKRQA